jgi:hypothetical protein
VGAPRQAPFLTRRSDGGKLTLEVSSSQFEEIILDVNKLHRSFHPLPLPLSRIKAPTAVEPKAGGLDCKMKQREEAKAFTTTEALASQVVAVI